MRVLLPEGWPRPSGYSNGIEAKGRLVFVAGQIGWDERGVFVDPSFPGQFRKVLENTLAVLAVAGAGPEHVVRMTWFVTDRGAYLASLKALGEIWRELMGRAYPVMSVVFVTSLVEREAMIEIESTAVLPD